MPSDLKVQALEHFGVEAKIYGVTMLCGQELESKLQLFESEESMLDCTGHVINWTAGFKTLAKSITDHVLHEE